MVVSLTSRVRCQRFWLRGDRKGEMEVFIDNLPGYPDNIRSTQRGTFWIGLVAVWNFLNYFDLLKYLPRHIYIDI